VSPELSTFHLRSNLLANGAGLWAPLDEEINYVVIEGQHGEMQLVFGIEYDTVWPGGVEYFANRRFRVTQNLIGRDDLTR
jgi:hypothetical protein